MDLGRRLGAVRLRNIPVSQEPIEMIELPGIDQHDLIFGCHQKLAVALAAIHKIDFEQPIGLDIILPHPADSIAGADLEPALVFHRLAGLID